MPPRPRKISNVISGREAGEMSFVGLHVLYLEFLCYILVFLRDTVPVVPSIVYRIGPFCLLLLHACKDDDSIRHLRILLGCTFFFGIHDRDRQHVRQVQQ